ncbi:hypothetical protein F5Y09DRAFT_13027 [Xylaria sp. FL1042]|nr:hypothetical protein F5Y09DRAFT_13027 [Xylaria sp. FL1042]
MEPLSALSVACNIIDLVSKAIKAGKTVLEMYESASGRSAVGETINREADGLKDIVADLQVCQSQPSYGTSDQKMRDISTRLLSQCVELQKVLDACRSSRKRSLVSAFDASLKLFTKNGKIGQLQRDIVSLRDELFHWITMSTRASVNDVLKRLQDISKRSCEIQKTVNDVEAQLRLALMNTDSSTEDGAATCLEEIREIMTDRVILQLLYTPILGSRFEEVQTQEEGTFKWIFTDPEAVLKNEPQLAMTFPAWLESGDGIFHVCGKPGSGKSTLMKYICRNPTTKTLLYKWADNNELLMAKFFFWRIGADEQKSMRGLIRGLLYQILDKVPKLSRDIFSREIRDRLVNGLQKHHSAELDSDELMAAFSRLVEVSTSSSLGQDLHGIRICLFIDGLDEFDIGKINQSYRGLVDKLRQWTKNSGGHMKMCVSSRIEEPFMDMLEERKRFTLHNLTTRDIKLFIEQSLGRHSKFQMHKQKSPEECRDLVDNIIQSAQGVFLWVAPVLKELEAGLDDGIPLKRLREIISEKPADLETLLEHIMSSISKTSRRGVEVLLSAMLRATGTLLSPRDQTQDYHYYRMYWFHRLSFGEFHLSNLGAFLILRAADTGVPMKNDITMSDFGLEKEGWLQDGMTDDQTMKAINNILGTRCKGLIDIVTDYNPSYYVVKFMHRSVPEFLFTYFGHASASISDHSSTVSISWSLLIDVKWLTAKYFTLSSLFTFLNGESISELSKDCWSESHIGSITLELLERFPDFVDMLKQTNPGDEWEDLFRVLVSIEQSLPQCRDYRLSVICESAFAGLSGFIDWLFRKTDLLANKSILPYLIFEGIKAPLTSYYLFDILFANGVDGRIALPPSEHENVGGKPAWHYVLLSMQLGIKYDTSWLFRRGLEDPTHLKSTIIELWLRHGANPQVRFRLSEDGRECVGVSSAPGNSGYICPDGFHLDRYEVLLGLQRKGKRELSLRDIVLDWKPPNESVLLELLKDDIEDESLTPQESTAIQLHSAEKVDDHEKGASAPGGTTTNPVHQESGGVTGSGQRPRGWVMQVPIRLYTRKASLLFILYYVVLTR